MNDRDYLAFIEHHFTDEEQMQIEQDTAELRQRESLNVTPKQVQETTLTVAKLGADYERA